MKRWRILVKSWNSRKRPNEHFRIAKKISLKKFLDALTDLKKKHKSFSNLRNHRNRLIWGKEKKNEGMKNVGQIYISYGLMAKSWRYMQVAYKSKERKWGRIQSIWEDSCQIFFMYGMYHYLAPFIDKHDFITWTCHFYLSIHELINICIVYTFCLFLD